MNNIKNLQEEYNHFIKKYGLPLISADDLRVEVYHKKGEVYTNHEHIFPKHDKEIMEFLNSFITRWEQLED
jgi:dephospho-CoA kinase